MRVYTLYKGHKRVHFLLITVCYTFGKLGNQISTDFSGPCPFAHCIIYDRRHDRLQSQQYENLVDSQVSHLIILSETMYYIESFHSCVGIPQPLNGGLYLTPVTSYL
jgi:hypothetical protein